MKKTKTKKKPIMGYDPLAWLESDTSDAIEASNAVGKTTARPVSDNSQVTAAMHHEQENTVTEESVDLPNLVLTLEARATIAQVEEFYKEMQSALTECCHISLDAGDVEVVDTAILQLLMVLVKEVQEVHGQIQWGKISDAFRAAARLIDIEDHLGIAV